MSKFVRGSLTGVIVAAAASYSFSEAIGARTDDMTKESVEFGTHITILTAHSD